MTTAPPRPVRPDDFWLLSQVPGIACVARDSKLQMFWSTEEFFRVPGVVDSVEDMMGTRLSDVLPAFGGGEGRET